MKVKVTYLKSEFDAAVSFLMKNNKQFDGSKSDLTKSLYDTIKSMKDAPYGGMCSSGTLGYLVRVNEIIIESANSDKCEVLVGIDIDPDCLNPNAVEGSEEDYDWLAAFLAGMGG